MATTKTKAAAETKKTTTAAVKVKVIQTYYDKQLKGIKRAGDTFEVDKARAAELESLKLVEI